MAGIDFTGLNKPVEQVSATQRTTALPTLEQAALLSRVAWRYNQSENRGRYQRLGNLVLETLDRKIGNLENALSSFSFPTSNSVFAQNARLITPDNNSDDIKGMLRAEIVKQGETTRFYKSFSRGRVDTASTDLAGETYTFDMRLGDTTESIEVSIPDNTNWGDMLELVADAINGSRLPVQAEVVKQVASGQVLPFLPKTGSILAISVNPDHADQSVSFDDTDNLLFFNLDMEATTVPFGPADEVLHTVRDASPARPTTLHSQTLAPEDAVTLSEGEYRIQFSFGDTTGFAPVYVESGMTNDELLQVIAVSLDLADADLQAAVADGTMSSGLLDPVLQEGRVLNVTLGTPKLGEQLSLVSYGGPWLSDINGFHDPTNGLPNWVAGGERYTASATANGWTEGRIYEYDGSSWNETVPEATNAVSSLADGEDYFFDGSSWSTTVSGDLLSTIGMTNAWPGADAQARINARTVQSETGTFAVDQGRAVVGVESSFGDQKGLRATEGFTEMYQHLVSEGLLEQGLDRRPIEAGQLSGGSDSSRDLTDAVIDASLRTAPSDDETGAVVVADEIYPLKVVAQVEGLNDDFSDVVGAYNSLRNFILSHSDLLEPRLAEQWREPVLALENELRDLGITESAGTQSLFVNTEGFWSGLTADVDAARAALADAPGGLVPRLQSVAESVREAGMDSLLVAPTLLEDVGPVVQEEFSNYESAELQKVIEANTDAERPEQSPYTEFTNILTDIISTKREALRVTAPKPGGGSILDRKA